jgi:hypothetical protein
MLTSLDFAPFLSSSILVAEMIALFCQYDFRLRFTFTVLLTIFSYFSCRCVFPVYLAPSPSFPSEERWLLWRVHVYS